MKKIIVGILLVIITCRFVIGPLLSGEFDSAIDSVFGIEPLSPEHEFHPEAVPDDPEISEEKVIWVEFHDDPPRNVPLDSFDFPVEEKVEKEAPRKSAIDGEKGVA